MDNDTKYAIIIAFFFLLSLIGAVILFSYLQSYAEVVNPAYRLGGAVAGFFIIFTSIFISYSKLVARPAPTIMKEAARAITKPKGFAKYESQERGFSIYYPKEWNAEESRNFSPVVFQSKEGQNLNIVTEKSTRKFLNSIQKDPSELARFLARTYDAMFKDFKLVGKSAIALNGTQFPMYTYEATIGGTPLRQIQVCYLDFKKIRIHWISWTVAVDEYENMKRVFEKMISTFEVT